MFIAALITITKTQKQLRCLLMNVCIDMKWYIYTMEYHLAIKNDKLLLFATTWGNAKSIMLGETRQKRTRSL